MNQILIYKNIDAKIGAESLTVGIKDILVRLENLNLGLPKEQQLVIEKIQRRRNRIEHYRYDRREEDESIIAESLQFIIFFIDDVLKNKLESDIENDLLREIQNVIFVHQERDQLAGYRLDRWMKETWKDCWKDAEHISDVPDEFSGTHDCPICCQSYLLIGYYEKPFCFYCNTSVDAELCENCGTTRLASEGCSGCDCDVLPSVP
jgi:hypothetical protein